MELGITKNKVHEITGWVAVVTGIISLAILNIKFILLADIFLPAPLYILSIIGLICALISLFTKGPKTKAWWGLGLNIFIFLFTIAMLIFSFNINPQP